MAGPGKTKEKYLRDYFLNLLIEIRKVVSFSINGRGELMPMLDTMKNSLVGKLQYPHSKMIDYGLHAITLEGAKNKRVDEIDEVNRVKKVMAVMERIIRAYD